MQYGPNNVGGVINLVSKEIPSAWSTTLAHKVAAGGQGQFLQDSALSSGGYLTDNFGMQVDANRASGEYWRAHSNTDISNLRVRAEWWLDDTTLLKASVQRYLVDMDLAGALSPDDYRRDPRQSTAPAGQLQWPHHACVAELRAVAGRLGPDAGRAPGLDQLQRSQ